jgi:hypothetical protein
VIQNAKSIPNWKFWNERNVSRLRSIIWHGRLASVERVIIVGLSNLKELNVDCFNVSAAGSESLFIALQRASVRLRKLTLCLDGGECQGECTQGCINIVKAIGKYQPQIEDLNLEDFCVKNVRAGHASRMDKVVNLEVVFYGNNTEWISGFSSLTCLSLTSDNGSDFHFLAQMQHLTSFTLLTNVAIAQQSGLADLKQLRTLSLENSRSIEPDERKRVCEEVAQLVNLTDLRIDCNHLVLFSQMKSLTRLDCFVHENLDGIEALTGLVDLVLHVVSCKPMCIRPISQLIGLQSLLVVAPQVKGCDVQLLSELPVLRNLDLRLIGANEIFENNDMYCSPKDLCCLVLNSHLTSLDVFPLEYLEKAKQLVVSTR